MTHHRVRPPVGVQMTIYGGEGRVPYSRAFCPLYDVLEWRVPLESFPNGIHTVTLTVWRGR